MKIRESGIPDEVRWASFFDCEAAVGKLFGVTEVQGDVVEFGCGYGSFTVPAAQRTSGVVTALDIEPGMIDVVRGKAASLGLHNIRAELRDFVADGAGVAAGSQAHAMIFNLLHLAQPGKLLLEARRTLRDGGVLSVMHWRSDIPTPRGPPLAIRPTPEQCRQWMADAGFRDIESVDLQDGCPFHFGLTGRR
ncbi:MULTISPECIES: class I SAM-dependent methyltransferase [Rhodanobacter]|uniref:class I SAM-dependent methyltransferase n=1 Tax=Rhodanobacter TaxID=75309 RepID=UPI00041E36E0|nr:MULTISPECIES: class I SAM-dependent methyltransferase [Rhodanobacter]TAN18053.1 MAG: class I SAM-dependent methyltransferase [Rhodanobacter sp.]UJJ54425.1 class I SAM-dependent methyltransferase [Rhodanobacter thiooxydans]